MGPLFFLVLLVPFTLNGIAVREAFFVSFLGSVGVPADTAFAAGFLFFLVTTVLALPGARDPAVGRDPRRLAAAARAWLTRRRRVRRRDLRRAAVDRAVPRERRGASTTVVVDNGSSDGTVELVRERFPAVRVIEAENRGLAAGWNRGHRGDSTPSFVLVLNADAWLVEDALDALLAAAGRASARRGDRRRGS